MKRRDFPVLILGVGLFPAILPNMLPAAAPKGVKVARRVLRNLPEPERVGLDRFRLYREQGWRFPKGLDRLLQQAPPGLEKQLERRIQTDFMEERVTRTAGWLLAETEADLAMVLMLTQRDGIQGIHHG